MKNPAEKNKNLNKKLNKNQKELLHKIFYKLLLIYKILIVLQIKKKEILHVILLVHLLLVLLAWKKISPIPKSEVEAHSHNTAKNLVPPSINNL
jgi:c-di-AMP phosphodiesterase-like protein